jgi:NADH-quinone oxidoreductase subunit K
MIQVAFLLGLSVTILFIGYLTAISSRDLVRLLISLELMFASVFIALIPLFSIPEMTGEAFGIAVLIVFTSSAELLVLIATIVLVDKQSRSISTEIISTGGDKV